MPGQVKAIIPDKFNKAAMLEVLNTEFAKYAPFLTKDFERTTTNWKGEKPKFTPVVIKGKVETGEMTLQVRVTGPKKGRDKWKWLNEGTDPHIIRPKGTGYPLQFKTGYTAGSKPGSTFTIRGGATGPEVKAMEVHHPGFPARGWSDLIIKEHETPFYRWMKAAMERAARESGHAIK